MCLGVCVCVCVRACVVCVVWRDPPIVLGQYPRLGSGCLALLWSLAART